MDLGEVAEALYGLPRADFTAARDERVRAARAAGDKELAGRIGKLRRPTVAGWLVNQLARDRPDAPASLAELGAALRTAHEKLDGGALRSLSQRRHQLVNDLLGAARELGAEAGQPVGDPVARELEEMFTAALGSAEAARALAGGRVAAAKDIADPGSVTWPGVDPGALPEPARPRTDRIRSAPTPAAGSDADARAAAKVGAASSQSAKPADATRRTRRHRTRDSPTPSAEPADTERGTRGHGTPDSPTRDAGLAERETTGARETTARPGPDPALERARMKARAELDRFTQARDQAESAAADARRESEAAAEAEDAAHRRVAELRAELTVAEREEQRSRESARAARRTAEDADRALRDTRRRHDIAEQRLAALED